jgi:hypothetical protein
MNANCPRCENGTINAFRHIAAGVCFLCGGTAKVNAATSAPVIVARSAGKRVEIKGFGKVEITRDGDDFRVETNSGWMLVSVTGRKVQALIVSDGLTKCAPVIVAGLASRLAA